MFKKILKFKDTIDLNMFSAIKWNFIGQIFSRLVNLISSIVLARLMSPVGYGRYIYLIGTLMFFVQLIGFSIRSSSVRNVAYLYSKAKEQCEKYIYISLLIAILFSLIGILILLLCSQVFVDNILVTEYSMKLLVIVSFAIFFEIICGVSFGILEGLKLFKSVNFVTMIVSGLKLLFSVFGFYFYDVNGAIIGWVCASMVGVFLSLEKIQKGLITHSLSVFRFKLIQCKSEIKLFIKFSLPSSLEALAVLFAMLYIQTQILTYGDLGKMEIAIFNIANQWKALIIYLPAIFINMLQSFFSGYHGKGDSDIVELLYKNTRKGVNIISIVLSIIFVFASDFIILFFGKEYSEASTVLKIMVIPVVFININALNRQLLLSKGKVWFITLNNVFTSVLMIYLFFYLADHTSLSMAFAVSLGISELSRYIIYFFVFKKYAVFEK